MSYVQTTRWYLTASKLKCFILNPEEYKIRFIDEMEIEWDDKRCFFLWSAFDYLVSYGRDKFFEEYYIDEWFVKDDIIQKLIEQWEDPSKLKKMLLPELRAMFYKDGEKKRLTPAEGRDLLGMYNEAMRQPAFDLWGEYEKQHEIIAEYRGLKLRWQLDRFDANRCIIRDRKTSGRIDNFAYDMENTFDYVLQMAFYYTLAKVAYGIECDVYLDVIGKQYPYASVCYKLTVRQLIDKLKSTIKPALDFFIECQEKNERPSVNVKTMCPVNRFDAMKSPYYPFMQCSIMNSAISPNEY